MPIKPFNIRESWDWLIILDACRYDFFVELWDIGQTESRLSLESCTLGFLEHLPHIPGSVVITSHPFVFLHTDKFTKVFDCGFDYHLSTCPPWLVTECLKRHFHEVLRYERRILWFLQPHHPFIGETRVHILVCLGESRDLLLPPDVVIQQFKELKAQGILERAYADNLKLVLAEVKRILPLLHGKVVITSDHGEGLGKPLRCEDKPVFGHPCNISELEVRLIPWCVVKGLNSSIPRNTVVINANTTINATTSSTTLSNVSAQLMFFPPSKYFYSKLS